MNIMGKRGEKGQLAIFVIIALVIVFVIAVIFLFPRLKIALSGGEFTPEKYLRSCIEPEIKPKMELLNKQGGYANPQGFLVLNETNGVEKIKYLCYTNEYYKTCTVQEAMIKTHYEQELNNLMKEKIKDCATSLKTAYEGRGYSVSQGAIKSSIDIVSSKMNVKFDVPMSVSKNQESNKYNGFTVEIRTEMYNLLILSQTIVEFENIYGDSEITTFMAYYPHLKIEKIKLSEGSKVYILSDIKTGESFRFASRSLSWPPGYRLQ